ncbi:hypothetical protein FRB91_006666 [Serendipita sp. 411]|nr:hypothetical protein FRB91_006666 [Serendipita sp. 411]
MSAQNPYAGWTTSKLIPSVIFILAPIVAVGLLVTWSLRFQGIRRQLLEGVGPLGYARNRQGPVVDDVRREDAPKISEIWLGEGHIDEEDEKMKASGNLSSSGTSSYVMNKYRWEEILPFALSPDPDSKLDELEMPTEWRVGTVIRMPSQFRYDEIAHMDVTDIDFQLGTLPISCTVPRSA